MALVGCCVDEPLFASDIMFTFMYSTMIVMFEHTHNRHIKGGDN